MSILIDYLRTFKPNALSLVIILTTEGWRHGVIKCTSIMELERQGPKYGSLTDISPLSSLIPFVLERVGV